MAYVLAAIVAALAVACLALLNERKNSAARASEAAERLARESARASALELDNVRLTERLNAAESLRAEQDAMLADRFKNLSNEILANVADTVRTRHSRELADILSPLKTDLESFAKTVGECYQSEARERFSLKEKISELVLLNNTVRAEAGRLATALRGSNRVQGEWGELVLETILQNSGLKAGVHYAVQEVTTDAEGRRLRPDVVVNFPDDRCVVIDSKVSLTAYMEYIEASTPETERLAGERHLQSVRNHIAELRRKNYQDVVGDRANDFVMMFIPNEPAYMTAMQLDPGLWQTAYDSRVVIVSPTHLISALRLIEQVWRYDTYNNRAAEIAEKAGNMYDKFVGFVDELTKVSASLERATTACGNALKMLSTGRGNLVGRAESLRQMGIKTKKTLSRTVVGSASDDADTPDDAQGSLTD